MTKTNAKKIRMVFFRLVPLVLVLVFGLSPVVLGEDKPTKKETIAFIQEKCDNLKIAENITSRVYTDEKDDCTFVVEVKHIGQSYRKYIFHLKEMDPGVIKNGFDPLFVLYTDFVNTGVILGSKEEKKERKKAVKLIKMSYDDNKQEVVTETNQEEVTFICNSEKSAEKVGKAMSHLIGLCGGKADLF
ncbi:MAG: hypothetical protein HQL04_00590 [Nitrospirae bacterium]|nr:hypothetical protein [Nitrospirota bacterium]